MSDEVCLVPAFADDDSIEDLINKEYAKGYEKGRADERAELLEEFEKNLMSKIREDTCGCAYDARVIIRDTLNQMYK